jgi:hypothetical protein
MGWGAVMKRNILSMLVLACLPVMALAAPNFSGTWVRDNTKSDKDSYPLYWLTRGGAEGGGGGQGGDYIITVKHDAKGLQITDPQRPLRNYTLDGKPRTVPTDTGIEKATITANAQGDTLVIGTVQPYGGMPGNATMKAQEVWSLSPDGKMLTITLTREIPASRQVVKQVFARK